MELIEYYRQEYNKGYRPKVIQQKIANILCCSESHVRNIIGGYGKLKSPYTERWEAYVKETKL